MPIVRPVSSEEWSQRQASAAAERAVEEKKQAARQNVEDWSAKLNSGNLTPVIPSSEIEAAQMGEPKSAMTAQIRKQLSRSGGVDNPAHGLAMRAMTMELAGRLNAAAGGSQANADDLSVASAHLREAAESEMKHHAARLAGNPKEALRHLVISGGHLASAVNSIPKNHTDILKDDWKNSSWQNSMGPDFVSLENVHKDVNGILGAYRENVKDTGAEVPAALPKAGPEVKMPTPRGKTEVQGQVNLDRNIDKEAANALKPSRDEQMAAFMHGDNSYPLPSGVVLTREKETMPKPSKSIEETYVGPKDEQLRPSIANPSVAIPAGIGRAEHVGFVTEVHSHWKRNNPGKDYYKSAAYNDPYKYGKKNKITVKKKETKSSTGLTGGRAVDFAAGTNGGR